MIEKVRYIKFDELEDLLVLYKHLHIEDEENRVGEPLEELWQQILNDPNLFYLGIEEDGKLVSSCTLAIIKNLTRGAKSYGVIENVVTHEVYRNKGYGTAVLKKAVEIAEEKNCYKVMLMTSRKEENILKFYEWAGFDRGIKIGFVMYLNSLSNSSK